MASQPLVSIGMPICNAETYLRQALQALLAQDYSNLELIISDNASTDSTGDICREFQKKDPRVRYVRQGQNQGAPWNFAFVVQQARGEYFMWAAHDDLWTSSYIRKCLAKLDSSPTAVLCCTEIIFIDGNGVPNHEWTKNSKNIETQGMAPAQRVHELILRWGWFAIYGLMRLEVTKKLTLGRSVFGCDVILLMELLMMGNVVKVPEPLFSYRVLKLKSPQDYLEVLNSEANPVVATKAPFTDLAANLLQTAYRSQISDTDKLAIFADFISTLTNLNDRWRQQITIELAGSGVCLSETRFAALLNLALSRAVPYEAFKGNAVLESFLTDARHAVDLLRVSDKRGPLLSGTTQPPRNDTYRRAVQLFDQGRLEEASKLFQEALGLGETSDLWHDWATARLGCGHPEDAEAGLLRALELDADNHRAALKLGIMLSNQGRNDLAVNYVAQSLAFVQESERADVLKLLSHCLSELDRE
jgi:tetratricopeptide (TPR) repeat protein